MTLGEAEDLLGAWDEEPPAFLSLARIEAMLAAFLGVKKRRQSAAAGPQAIPGLGTGGDVHAGLGGAAILDFAALKAGTHSLPSAVHQRWQTTGEKSGR